MRSTSGVLFPLATLAVLLLGACVTVTVVSAAAADDIQREAVPRDAAASHTQSTDALNTPAGSALRKALAASRAAADAFSDVFPGVADAVGRAAHSAVHLPMRLLGGATARGNRDDFGERQRAQRADPKAADPLQPERAAGEHLRTAVNTISKVIRLQSPDERNAAADNDKQPQMPGLQAASPAAVDALSRLHIRAAELAGTDRRARRSAVPNSAEDPYAGLDDSDAVADAFEVVGDDAEIAEAASRTDRRLVQLLRWRKTQRGHEGAPAIPPKYLPHYAKGFSSHPEAEEHRRGFAAQQAAERPQFAYCYDGIAAIPGFVNFTCNASGTVENRTAAEVAASPPEYRGNCTPKTAARACICPRDSVPGRTVFGDVVCFWREIRCGVARVNPPPCPNVPVDQVRRVERCTTMPRDSSIDLTVNVTCRYAWANPRDYAFFGVDLLSIPPEGAGAPTFLVLNTTNTTQPIVRDLSTAAFAAFGTYEQVANAVFLYPVEPATSVMPLTSVHPAVANLKFYWRATNFNRLSDRSQQLAVTLGSPQVVEGQVTGDVPVTFRVNLAGIPDDFLHAARLFIEVGVNGRAAQLQPEAVVAQPFTIDFTDVPIPPPRSQQGDNTGVIVAAVLVPVAVIAIVGGIVFWRWRVAKKEKLD